MGLILVRHGQTAVNAEGRLQGRIDAPLTELGERQAAAVAAAVGPVGRVMSSPLQRARATAAAIAGAGADVDVDVDERWIELDYGSWDGAVLRTMDQTEWDRWRRDPSFAPPGGESLVALATRVEAACEALVDEAREHDVVVVSHVSPIKAAVAWALGVGPETSWRMFLGVNAVCRIAIGPRGPSLTSYNDLSHLASIT
jgi:broad specificity phosphatase PhoE